MNGCHREDDRTLARLIRTRVLVGALIRFAVIVAWKLINSEFRGKPGAGLPTATGRPALLLVPGASD